MLYSMYPNFSLAITTSYSVDLIVLKILFVNNKYSTAFFFLMLHFVFLVAWPVYVGNFT